MIEEEKPPILRVYDPIKKVERAIASVKKQQKSINWLMGAVVIVVVIGFITVVIAAFAIFIDHEDYAEQRFQQYINSVEKSEERLQLEIENLKNLDVKVSEEVKFPQEDTENNLPINADKTK